MGADALHPMGMLSRLLLVVCVLAGAFVALDRASLRTSAPTSPPVQPQPPPPSLSALRVPPPTDGEAEAAGVREVDWAELPDGRGAEE